MQLHRWLVVGIASLVGSAALAQPFPSKPVTMIVPWPAAARPTR
jgi:tripartite-type tricarboxylate transporter receptor subunit TctC